MQFRIGELRKAAGMKQSELAEAVGVSTSAVGMYEQGRREPDMKMLLRLAQLFDVSTDYLLGASSIAEPLDSGRVAACVAADLMNRPELLFRTECDTEEELKETRQMLEACVQQALQKALYKPDFRNIDRGLSK